MSWSRASRAAVRRFVCCGRRSTATWTITAASCCRARSSPVGGAAREASPTRARAATTAASPPSAASRWRPCASVSLDARIDKLTGIIAKVDAALADGAFQKDAAKASELARMRAEAAAALAGAEEEWLTVGAELEEAQA